MKLQSLLKAIRNPRILKEALNRRFFHIRMRINGNVFQSDKMHSKMYLPYYATDLIQGIILHTADYYERDQLDKVCKEWNHGVVGKRIKESAVLDIGTNIGNHTLYYLNECQASFVYCFEPIQDTYNILKKNIQVNGLETRTQLNRFGIGEHQGKANIAEYDQNNIGGTSIEISNEGNIEVRSIDELDIKQKIGLIKVDVEGLEVEAVLGMIETIKKYHPYITIEINDGHFDTIWSQLQPLGYTYIEIAEHPNYCDYLFYC